jgi:hypothetical protein
MNPQRTNPVSFSFMTVPPRLIVHIVRNNQSGTPEVQGCRHYGARMPCAVPGGESGIPAGLRSYGRSLIESIAVGQSGGFPRAGEITAQHGGEAVSVVQR